jgi:hypothetical protein
LISTKPLEFATLSGFVGRNVWRLLKCDAIEKGQSSADNLSAKHSMGDLIQLAPDVVDALSE